MLGGQQVRAATESSGVVGAIARIGGDSFICRWACARVGALGRTGARLGKFCLAQHHVPPPCRDFSGLGAIARDSQLLTAIDQGFVKGAAMVIDSRAARIVAAVSRDVADLDAWQRVRLVGLILIIGTIAHSLVIPVGTHAIGIGGWLASAGLVALGSTLVLASKGITVAWTSRRFRVRGS